VKAISAPVGIEAGRVHIWHLVRDFHTLPPPVRLDARGIEEQMMRASMDAALVRDPNEEDVNRSVSLADLVNA
jgi:hypothetical protein